MKRNSALVALAALGTVARMFYRPPIIKTYSETAFQPIIKGIRSPKDPALVAVIERCRRARKLSRLSRPKRRAIYYYNLRHPVKMYAVEGGCRNNGC